MADKHPLADAKLPVESFKEAAPHLRRPFTAEAVKWMAKTESLVVPYIDARLAIERLNLVCPDLWSDEYEPLAGGAGLLCRLTVDGITRLDVGSDYKGKGLYSDAFKRACVKFGIGVSLYALPKVFLSESNGHLKKSGKSTVVSEAGEKRLASGYRAWLKETGEATFGPALDHGDVEGAIGDPEAEAPADDSGQTAIPDASPKLEDPEALGLIAAAESTYADLTAAEKKDLPKAAFRRTLAGAWHSLDELKTLVAELEKRGQG